MSPDRIGWRRCREFLTWCLRGRVDRTGGLRAAELGAAELVAAVLAPVFFGAPLAMLLAGLLGIGPATRVRFRRRRESPARSLDLPSGRR